MSREEEEEEVHQSMIPAGCKQPILHRQTCCLKCAPELAAAADVPVVHVVVSHWNELNLCRDVVQKMERCSFQKVFQGSRRYPTRGCSGIERMRVLVVGRWRWRGTACMCADLVVREISTEALWMTM